MELVKQPNGTSTEDNAADKNRAASYHGIRPLFVQLSPLLSTPAIPTPSQFMDDTLFAAAPIGSVRWQSKSNVHRFERPTMQTDDASTTDDGGDNADGGDDSETEMLNQRDSSDDEGG